MSLRPKAVMLTPMGTVESVLRDHPFCPAKAVSQDRSSFITGRTNINWEQSVPMKTVLRDEWQRLHEIGYTALDMPVC